MKVLAVGDIVGLNGIKELQKTLQKVKQELDKCILVCANCHREIHYKEGSDN